MADDQNIPQNKPEQNETPDSKDERFESDTQKIVRKHLEDPDHVITEEEMQQIRVGMTSPEDEQTALERLEDENKVDEAEKKILGDTPQQDKPGENRITPWDTIEP